MNHSPILVLGATGKTGRRIVERLLDKGHAVRKGSRQSDPPFAWGDRSNWDAVLEVEGDEPRLLQQGSLALMPHGTGHCVRSSPEADTEPRGRNARRST